MELTYTLPEIDELARVFWESFPDKKIYAFKGNMGAGKTSFIRALCTAKKVKETVGSPTFSIINEYSFTGGIIYHLDLYRLKDEQEAIQAGVEDCLYSALWNGLTGLPVFSLKTASEFYWKRSMKTPAK